MLVSLALALVGIAIAWWLYVRQTDVPGRIAARVPWAYKASLNKVYMDDIYAVVPVGATLGFAGWLWTFFDAKVIDGAVNGVARLWGWVGDRPAAHPDGPRAELRDVRVRRHGRARRRPRLGVGELT